MMRYLTLLAMVLAVFLAAPAMGEIHLNYLGAQDMGDGTYLHEYEGVRDSGDETPIRDLHIEGKFDFEPGTITITSPNDWSGVIYTGPGPFLFNWQLEEGEPPWTLGPLHGFGIMVSTPMVTQTPFHWTDNPQMPQLPDLGNVISTGMTMVPVPEPASLTLLGLGGLLALGLFVRGRRAR